MKHRVVFLADVGRRGDGVEAVAKEPIELGRPLDATGGLKDIIAR